MNAEVHQVFYSEVVQQSSASEPTYNYLHPFILSLSFVKTVLEACYHPSLQVEYVGSFFGGEVFGVCFSFSLFND